MKTTIKILGWMVAGLGVLVSLCTGYTCSTTIIDIEE